MEAGLWLLATGVTAVVLRHGFAAWLSAAVIMSVGMARLYPNLIASVADIDYPTWRSSPLSAYRYWRDTGYSIGALVLGLIPQARGAVEPTYWVTAGWLMLLGLWVLLRSGNPSRPPSDGAKPMNSIPQLLVGGFIVSLVFGASAQAPQFCPQGRLREVMLANKPQRLSAYFAAIALPWWPSRGCSGCCTKACSRHTVVRNS